MFMESCFASITEKRIKRLLVICLELGFPRKEIEKYHEMTPTENGNSDVRHRSRISLKVTIPTKHHDNFTPNFQK